MDVVKILEDAKNIVANRGKAYGGIEQNFSRAAAIASLKLNKMFTAYEIAVILESVKDARRAETPNHYDSHVDGINYKAFAWVLKDAERIARQQASVVKRPRGRPRKHPLPAAPVVKRPRGRPRKIVA